MNDTPKLWILQATLDASGRLNRAMAALHTGHVVFAESLSRDVILARMRAGTRLFAAMKRPGTACLYDPGKEIQIVENKGKTYLQTLGSDSASLDKDVLDEVEQKLLVREGRRGVTWKVQKL